MARKTGAPEIEITDEMKQLGLTPEMVKAGLAYLDDAGLNCLTTRTLYAEFLIIPYRFLPGRFVSRR